MDNKLHEVSLAYSDQEEDKYVQSEALKDKIRKVKNLTNPKGTKVTLYEQELNQLDDMSDAVSVTSGRQKELDRYDSDIDITVQKVNYQIPRNVNMSKIKNMTLSSGS
jgi:hypothetical protein